jgi:hypothetical protein
MKFPRPAAKAGKIGAALKPPLASEGRRKNV